MTLCEGVEAEAVLSLRHAERVLEAMHSQVGAWLLTCYLGSSIQSAM
jgi:hypothetical protein